MAKLRLLDAVDLLASQSHAHRLIIIHRRCIRMLFLFA